MHTSFRGFISLGLTLVLIIAAALIGGGAYYARTQAPAAEPYVPPEEASTTPTSTNATSSSVKRADTKPRAIAQPAPVPAPSYTNARVTVPGSVTLAVGETAVWDHPGYVNDGLPFITLISVNASHTVHVHLYTASCDSVGVNGVSPLSPCQQADAILALGTPLGVAQQTFTLVSATDNNATIQVTAGNTTPLGVTPMSGPAPLKVFFSGTAAPTYSFDYGDGTPVRQTGCGGGGCSGEPPFTDYHTYTTPGVYTAILRESDGSTHNVVITVTNI